MKIISCFDEIIDGAIGTVADKVEDKGIIIQEAKTNKLYTDDATKIKESCIAITETLKQQDVSGICATSNSGDL